VLSPDEIIRSIADKASGKRVWLAYSGGVDSHVLLHLLATADIVGLSSIHAIYIDHGLQAQSQQWALHCAAIAAELEVDFVSVKVTVENIECLGMEAAARAARYRALEHHLTKNDVLLTGQHQEDQAETLLLQLLRGAGPKGLAAMAADFKSGDMNVLRPLLTESQSDILDYAHQHQLNWVEDPSNADTRWNRNYLRHTLWPSLVERWPSAARTLSRSAEHCAEASSLLDDLAELDLQDLVLETSKNSLPIDQLLSLSSARRNNLLRFFINLKQFLAPSKVNLQRIVNEVCLAKKDSAPVVSWTGVEIRRYQNQLYFMAPLIKHDNKQLITISGTNDIDLGYGYILEWQPCIGRGIKASLITDGLSLRFRQGGERIKPQGSQHHRSVKHLFQQWAIPPWQRERIPLIFKNNEMVAITDYCVSDFASAIAEEQGYFPIIKIA